MTERYPIPDQVRDDKIFTAKTRISLNSIIYVYLSPSVVYNKIMVRLFVHYFIVAFVLAIFISPVQAKKGFLEAMFPGIFGDYLEKQAKPEETLRAPFAYDPRKEPEPLNGLPQNATPIHLPHRGDGDVQKWVTTHVTGVLSYMGQTYQEDLENFLKTMSESGKREYLDFLQTYQIDQTLSSGKYFMRGFAEKTPLLLQEGSQDGRYHWLYEIPVMVTYLDRRVKSYEQVAKPITHAYLLKVKVGRVEEGGGSDAILIESWKAEPVKSR